MNIAVHPRVPLGDFMLSRGGTTDPLRLPNDSFVLYSIPSFDVGEPECVIGKNIGSPKKNVRSGDVLLSRIVPHIRRSWIVGDHPGQKTLASGEWIVFRSDRIHGPYLRHFLVSDVFHLQFMQTVAGVGGSLLRANPNYVAEIEIPLPPLDEQRRIAAILDKADALRRKRKRAIDLLGILTQSIFLEMFGDPVSNPKGWDVSRLGKIADFYSGNSLPAGEKFVCQPNGYLLLKVSDLNKKGNEEIIVASSEWSPSPGAKAGTCKLDAVVFPKRGGAIATNKKRKLFRPAILDPNLMAVAPAKGQVTIDYLFAWFQNFRLEDIASGSSVPQLNKQDLSPLKICTPPLDLQEKFAAICQEIISHRAVAATATTSTEFLFSSLQSRAFSGQL